MACVHLRQLYQLCQDHDLKLGGSELIRIVCRQCGEQDVCPANLVEMDEPQDEQAEPQESADRKMGRTHSGH